MLEFNFCAYLLLDVPSRYSNTLSNITLEKHRKSVLSVTQEDDKINQKYEQLKEAPRDFR